MKTITEVRGALYFIANHARALQRIFESSDFEYLFNRAGSDQQDALFEKLEIIDLKPIRLWIKTEQYKAYETLTTRQLRVVAKTLGIKYFSLKTKDELLTDIGAVYEQRNNKIPAGAKSEEEGEISDASEGQQVES